MKRRALRGFLIIALLAVAVFAGWAWFRPYAWQVDPAARCKVVGTQVTRDHANFWVEVHLRVSPGESHDLMKPVRLHTAAGRDLEPADTLTGSEENRGLTELWFKFWLDAAEIEGPLTLRINDGSLVIKSTSGIPAQHKGIEYFVTHRW